MPAHALVIGIDGYAGDWKLEGAVNDALRFAEWLVSTRPDVQLRLLLSPPREQLPAALAHAAPPQEATFINIIKQLNELAAQPADPVPGSLFFYFSGHGCSAPAPYFDRDPVLIPSDYVDPAIHFNQLLPLSLIIPKLAASRSFSEQLFFIDACRGFIPEGMAPGMLTSRSSNPIYDGPEQYVLYATSPGQQAQERGMGVWTDYLLKGLAGEHGALAPSPTGGTAGGPCYEVRFRNLAQWVEARMLDDLQRRHPDDWQQRLQKPQYKPDPRPRDPVLAVLDPDQVEPLSISVLIDPPAAASGCRLVAREFRNARMEYEPLTVFGPPVARLQKLQLPMSHYKIEAASDRYYGISEPLYLTSSRSIRLQMQPRGTGQPSLPTRRDERTGLSREELLEALARLDAAEHSGAVPREGFIRPVSRGLSMDAGPPRAPAEDPSGVLTLTTQDPDARISLRDAAGQMASPAKSGAAGGREVRFLDLTPGMYAAELYLPEGKASEQTVLVTGADQYIELLPGPAPTPPAPHVERLLVEVGYDAASGVAYPSELLGAVSRPRLASLLGFAAMAANHPERAVGSFHKLAAALPVTPFASFLAERGLEAADVDGGVLILFGSAVGRPAPSVTADQFIANCECSILRPASASTPAELIDQGLLEPLVGGDPATLGSAAARQAAVTTAGPLVIEFRLSSFCAARCASVALPGRLTVLVAVVTEGGAIEIQQYLLPLPESCARQDPNLEWEDAATMLQPDHLRHVELAQRLYSRGAIQSLADPSTGLDATALAGLLAGDWVDPLTTAMAGYALHKSGSEAYAASGALERLTTLFPDLPDAHILAGLHLPAERDQRFERALRGGGLPILSEGLEAVLTWADERRAAGEPEPDSAALREATAVGLLPGPGWTSWRALRPALEVKQGRFAPGPPDWAFLEKHRARIEGILAAVGRIEPHAPASYPFVGSGFLVGPNLLMTASFSIAHLVEAKGDGWALKAGVDLRVDFRSHASDDPPGEFRVTDVARLDESLRLALLTIETDPAGASLPSPLTLAAAPPFHLAAGRAVFVAGYPAFDSRVNAALFKLAMQGADQVKRLMPGYLLGALDGNLHYDCLTMAGSAGGPLVDLETGLVLAMHHSGLKDYKGGTALWPLASHPFFQGAGVAWEATPVTSPIPSTGEET